MEIYKTLILSVVAYFIGSISFSYIITKKIKGKDIRNMGIKNAGAFNVFISIGPFMGILVGLLDCLKTLVIVVAAQAWGLDAVHSIVAASFGIVGHCFPAYYSKFYGGKGAASLVGIFIYFIPAELLLSIIPSFLIAYKINRIGRTPIFLILLSPIVAYLLKKPHSLIFALIYVEALIALLNFVIVLSKRDQNIVSD